MDRARHQSFMALIVEANHSEAMRIRRVIEEYDVIAFVATNIEQAKGLLNGVQFDLITLNLDTLGAVGVKNLFSELTKKGHKSLVSHAYILAISPLAMSHYRKATCKRLAYWGLPIACPAQLQLRICTLLYLMA